MIFQSKLSKTLQIPLVSMLANITMLSNVFIWYYIAFKILKDLVGENVLAWGIHFIGAATSALIGGTFSSKMRRKLVFFIFWMLLGVISPIIPMVANPSVTTNKMLIAYLFGASFGLGLPASMDFFVASTDIRNRAKLAGLILLINEVGAFLLLTAIFSIASDGNFRLLILSILRMAGLICLIGSKTFQRRTSGKMDTPFTIILTERSFILYFIPWSMFSLVNFLSVPIQYKILDPNLVNVLNLIENTLVGFFAVIGGILADGIGRKRITIFAFVMLGLGYSILGMYPENLLSWYFYTLVDAIAWGVFSVIFIFTLWGDLSRDKSSDKQYALGGLPFFLSNFLRLTIGSFIYENIPPYAIFSFIALFLFLAIIPLTFAPETLPEKMLRERELRGYIEKAKRVREKFTKS